MKKSAGRPREFVPEDFLNTALNCFWQTGFRATSLSEIMKASGLASASIYKLYPDKRAIFLAALEQYMDAGLQRGSKRDAALPPEQALREMLEFVALVSTGPDGVKGCFTISAACELLPGDEDVRKRVEYKFQSIISRFTGILKRGQETGVFRTDESAEVMAKCLFMLVEGMRVYGKIQPELHSLRKSNDFIISTVLAREEKAQQSNSGEG